MSVPPPPPNKIRLAFKTKADAEVFVEKGLPQLKDLGYAFKTEGTKDGYWDQRGSSTSGASIRTSTSWSTKGSTTPTEKDDHVVLVDIPEYLPPNEILSVVKHALTSRSIPVEDTQVSLEKLRWSMGDIWQPNWSVRAPGIKGLAGVVLTLTDQGVPSAWPRSALILTGKPAGSHGKKRIRTNHSRPSRQGR